MMTISKINILNVLTNTENIILFFFIILSLVVNLFPVSYGYNGDELYYIALSKHLDFGYVDVPPLMPLCIAVMRFLFGTSKLAMHFLPAIFSVVILILTREIVRKLGGKSLAQALALACVSLAPPFVCFYSFITYNSFDGFFWALCLYFLTLLLTKADRKYWLYIGIVSGLGIMSKPTMLWLDAGITLAMLFTRDRKYFLTRQFWIACGIALLIISPFLIWIATHQFLTIEYFFEYSKKTADLSILKFIQIQVNSMHLSSMVWISGLYYFFFTNAGRKYRLFGFMYIFIFTICIILQSKSYVLAPFFPVLFAGGAVLIEKVAQKTKLLRIVTIILLILVIIVGLIVLPASRPIFPVETQIKYLKLTHLYSRDAESNTERTKQGALPQHMSECFGWEEMAEKIAKIYYSLSESERAETAILAGGFSTASGIYFYGEKYNLPIPISTHLQYYLWGYRNAATNGTIIFVNSGDNINSFKSSCEKVIQVGKTDNKYAMPYANNPIFLCRSYKKSMQDEWQKHKNMGM